MLDVLIFASTGHNSDVGMCLFYRFWVMRQQPSQPAWSFFVFTESTMTSWSLLLLSSRTRCCAVRWLTEMSPVFIVFSFTDLISLIKRWWWMWATISRRTCIQRPTLSICRSKEKLNSRVMSCLLDHVVETIRNWQGMKLKFAVYCPGWSPELMWWKLLTPCLLGLFKTDH